MATELNFNVIETGNCKTLGIVDTSNYIPGQVIVEPTLTVYVPGYPNPVAMNFLSRRVNIYNSNNLNVTCSDDGLGLINLPDGVYKAIYTIKPSTTYSTEKQFLRTCKIECKLDGALLKVDILNCEDRLRVAKINKLKEIDFMISSAKASANIGDAKLALELYKRADQELDILGAKCN